jgi:uncharacterized membrane protein YidH (DUF202 family)
MGRTKKGATPKNWNGLHNKKTSMKNIGILIMVIGLGMMAFTGFNYITREKVVDLGSVQINADKTHPVRWSPIVGGVLLVAGFVVFMTTKKN